MLSYRVLTMMVAGVELGSFAYPTRVLTPTPHFHMSLVSKCCLNQFQVSSDVDIGLIAVELPCINNDDGVIRTRIFRFPDESANYYST